MAMPMSEYELEALPEMEEEYEGEWEGEFESEEFFRRLADWAQQRGNARITAKARGSGGCAGSAERRWGIGALGGGRARGGQALGASSAVLLAASCLSPA